ncbi:TPA: hypothetical protein ACPJIH_001949 [Haemophilus influenzae]
MRNTTFIKAAAKKEKTQNFCISRLTDKTRLNYINPAFSKLRAGRDKLNILQANDSTPFNRAFLFVAFTHLSKIIYLLIDYSQW